MAVSYTHLEAIFERTFGKSASGKGGGSDTEGRFGYERKKWSKKPKESVYDAGGVEYLKRHEKSPKSGKQYLLVDGYNIIFSWKELNDLSKENLEAARTKLMDILCNYQGFKGCELILVFDAVSYTHLSRIYRLNSDENEKKILPLNFGEVITWIEKKFRQDLSVEELSKKAGYSQRHFLRIFKETYHMTPTEYINAIRIEYACSRLRETEESVTDIAYDCRCV